MIQTTTFKLQYLNKKKKNMNVLRFRNRVIHFNRHH